MNHDSSDGQPESATPLRSNDLLSGDTETIDRLFLELSQFTKATTSRELALEKRLQKIQIFLEGIVCTTGEDAGVILLSTESPTNYDAEKKCQVYELEYFSPLGNALMELWEMVKDR